MVLTTLWLFRFLLAARLFKKASHGRSYFTENETDDFFFGIFDSFPVPKMISVYL
jgi:hypothetical protein